MKTIAIYSRVSTDKQSCERQIVQLQEFAERAGWTIYKIFTDEGYSGRNTKRPEYRAMMEAARKRRFNALLVWDLSRLSRSLKDLINTIEHLEAYKVDFIAFNQNFDTSTPSGRLLFEICGAINQFQLAITKEAIMSGLDNARRKGVKLGRPGLEISDETKQKIKELRDRGLSLRDIAKKVGISHASVSRMKF